MFRYINSYLIFLVTVLIAGCSSSVQNPISVPTINTPNVPSASLPSADISTGSLPDAREVGAKVGSTTSQNRVHSPSQGARLGTQWGEGLSSKIQSVNLSRYSSTPTDVKEISYSAASYKGQRIKEAMIANGRIGMAVIDEDYDKLTLTQSGNDLFLTGRDGERYQLYYRNYSQRTYEIVATVDGQDVLNGEPGSISNRGYVLMPNSELVIDGFRKSREEVAAFRFSAPRNSYAANSSGGSIKNTGIIGTAVFELNNPKYTPARNNGQSAPEAFPADNINNGGFAPPPNYR